MSDLFGVEQYDGLQRDALLSADGRYRFWLSRHWRSGGNRKVVCFVMLNPSVADAEIDDPTIRRCMAYAQAWGYTKMTVRNLFPFRATEPKALLAADEPDGGELGLRHLLDSRLADMVVAAWGAWVPFERDREFLRLVGNAPLHCLKLSKGGKPCHPLYLPGDLVPVPFTPVAETGRAVLLETTR